MYIVHLTYALNSYWYRNQFVHRVEWMRIKICKISSASVCRAHQHRQNRIQAMHMHEFIEYAFAGI